MTFEEQTIGMSGIENARQLGGYLGLDGRKVKKDLLLRTGKLTKGTCEDLKRLEQVYQVTRIIDLRTTAEILEEPDPELKGAVNTGIPVLDEEQNKESGAVTSMYAKDPLGAVIHLVSQEKSIENLYASIAMNTHSQKAFRAFFEILLHHKKGAVLWHCTGGKDRTGMAAVFLLWMLGVDRETILEDFSLTNAFFHDKIEEAEKKVREKTDDEKVINAVRSLMGVNRDYMEIMIDTIEKNYGSMEEYFRVALGVTEQEQKVLCDVFLE